MAAKSIDFHGARSHEVEERLDRFLYEAQLAGYKNARIVTGKGSGTVQKIVKDYLRKGGYPFFPEKTKNGSPNEGVLIVVVN